jgi:hypothetical protein
MHDLTPREQDLLAALASTAGYTEERMRAYLGQVYPALALGAAIRKEADKLMN